MPGESIFQSGEVPAPAPGAMRLPVEFGTEVRKEIALVWRKPEPRRNGQRHGCGPAGALLAFSGIRFSNATNPRRSL